MVYYVPTRRESTESKRFISFSQISYHRTTIASIPSLDQYDHDILITNMSLVKHIHPEFVGSFYFIFDTASIRATWIPIPKVGIEVLDSTTSSAIIQYTICERSVFGNPQFFRPIKFRMSNVPRLYLLIPPNQFHV